ncbi:MAG: hypothetical protein U9Q79_02840, partial [Candidatus Hydrogenedentes bacterium]|nr:hypothetical protein [Candidatus Hydrogenedentota bacterium]
MSGYLQLSEKERKRKVMFNAVFKKWLPPSLLPLRPVTLAKAGVQCASTRRLCQALWIPACAGMT